MAAEDFAKLPERQQRLELVDGEVRGRRWLYANEGAAVDALAGHIGQHCRGAGEDLRFLLRAGFVLRRGPDTVRAPSAAVLRAQPEDRLGDSFVPGAPALAIEVALSEDGPRDATDRAREWLAAGSSLVWTIDADEQSLVIHRPDGSSQTFGPEDEVNGGDVLPGFRMKVANLLHPFKR